MILEFSEPVKYATKDIPVEKLLTVSISGATGQSYDLKYKVPYWGPNQYQKSVFIEISISQELKGDETFFVYIDHVYVTDIRGYNLLKRNATSKKEYIPLTSSVKGQKAFI